MAYDRIFLDLDGTISDSKPGIIASIRYALDQYGIKPELPDMNVLIGPPLRESFKKHFGFTDANVNEVIFKFRERYTAKGVFELSLYPGIKEMLTQLHTMGKTIFLATSKEEDYARQILDYTGLAPLFNFAGGACLDKGRLSKADVLRYVCEAGSVADMTGCVMVGDREHDVHGAHELGMPCIGVTYGYGGKVELTEAGADYIADTVAELGCLLMR